MRVENIEKKYYLNVRDFKKRRAKRIVRSLKNKVYLKKIKNFFEKNKREDFNLNFNKKILPYLKTEIIKEMEIDGKGVYRIRKHTLPQSLENLEIGAMELVSNCFENLICLKTLFLHRVSFTRFDFFPSTLTYLKIIDTNLSSDDTKILDNLMELNTLILNNNNLKNILFLNLCKLKHIDLSCNQIIIDRHFINIIEKQLELRKLFLSSNHLTVFPGIKSIILQELCLSNNDISDIDEKQVSNNLPSLEVLNLSNNFLKKSYFLGDLIRSLNLSGNEIDLDSMESINRYPWLFVLDLSHNKFELFPPITSDYLGELILSNNNISDIDEEQVVNDLPALQSINLSHNKVKKIPFLGSEITNINLSGNQIHNVFQTKLYLCVNLVKINLSMNQLRIFPDMPLMNLKHITICDSNIFDIDENTVQQALPNLEFVSLSSNKLRKIPFLGCNIEVLILCENEIIEYHGGILHRYKKLKELDVSGNFYQDIDQSFVHCTRQRQFQSNDTSYPKLHYLSFLQIVRYMINSQQYALCLFTDNNGCMS